MNLGSGLLEQLKNTTEWPMRVKLASSLSDVLRLKEGFDYKQTLEYVGTIGIDAAQWEELMQEAD